MLVVQVLSLGSQQLLFLFGPSLVQTHEPFWHEWFSLQVWFELPPPPLPPPVPPLLEPPHAANAKASANATAAKVFFKIPPMFEPENSGHGPRDRVTREMSHPNEQDKFGDPVSSISV